MTTRLGLDLGPNSIGWALLDDKSILAAGVRVFEEGVDNFDTGKEKSRNENRRTARGMRRQTRRRAARGDALRKALVRVGLLPDDTNALNALLDEDVYQLRARALSEKLSAHQIGRVLLNLNRRRGFWSPRKRPVDKESGEILKEIGELDRAIGPDGTLGSYLHGKQKALDHARRVEDDHVRNRHTRRTMLENEFNAIWRVQASYYPKLLTEELRCGQLGIQKYPQKPIPRHHPSRKGLDDLKAFGLHGLIFFQRPIYWPKSFIGLCELEPKQVRCPRAHRLYERFRLLSELNNLRYVDPDMRVPCALDPALREAYLAFMATRPKATFDQIRKALNFSEAVRFNLEKGKRSSLLGMPAECKIVKAVGKIWHDRDEDQKNAIMSAMLHPGADEDELFEMLMEEYGFTDEQAEALVAVDLPSGYGSLSLKAIGKLLPHLEQGLVYMAEDDSNSALHAAGYLRRDQLQRRIFDKLPEPGRQKDCPIGDIPNPVVKRALNQLRKVVNSIIREYGKPDEIHMEMAREVQLGKKRRVERIRYMRQREETRNVAADEIRKRGLRVTGDAIDRYLFWIEQGGDCIYCGKKISQVQLFTGEVDIDHILPISLSHDNSKSNRVVCHRHCNHEKGQGTIHEWLAASDHERYDKICTRAHMLLRDGNIPYAKYRKIIRKSVDSDEFLSRQLVDTGYITRAASEYLRCLFGEPHKVLGLKGQYTATLRRMWGLGDVIAELPDSPAWREQNKLRDGEKNRADHRHHTMDAIVLALTDRPRLQKLTAFLAAKQQGRDTEAFDPPWPTFRQDVKNALEPIRISHQVQRGVRGSLHDDTLYGQARDDRGNIIDGRFVVRKPLADLTANEIAKILDKTIRNIVIAKLAENGIEAGRGKKPDARVMKETLSNVTMPSGVPINKVRVYKEDLTIEPIRIGKPGMAWVKPGNTHHHCIFEWTGKKGKIKRGKISITMLEATRRRKVGEPIIQRIAPTDHPDIPADARFVMSLAHNEMVLANVEGQEKLLVFVTSPATTQQLFFVEHTDARRSGDKKKISFTPNTLNASKVTVDPIGRIRWAND
ncbi:MAG: type II CRISPR RNA-guided endonuclease Cas9 [Phycisphaerae bacterium]|nr:type II CRISPR RNA-guided endonuclease Cas9 [Phycisphaerae bacterium]